MLHCWDLWDRCYVTCCYAADGVGWGGVGGACQRSLYFVHYSVLRCNDLWDLKLRYMLLRCWDLWDLTTLLVTTLLRSLGSLLRYLLLRVSSFQLYQFPNTNLSFRIPFSSFRIRLPVSEYHFPVSEYHFQFPNTSFRIPLPSFRIPLSSFRIPLSSFRIPLSSFRIPLSSFRIPLPVSEYQFPNTTSSFRIPLASFRIPPWPLCLPWFFSRACFEGSCLDRHRYKCEPSCVYGYFMHVFSRRCFD